MENKKVDFILTPRVDFSNGSRYRTRTVSSTPYSKSSKLLQFTDLKFEDSLCTATLNNTGNVTNREKSTLYPQQNDESNVRIVREFEFLSLKYSNHKCEKLIEESTKKIEKKIKRTTDLLRRKQEHLIEVGKQIERKQLLIGLRESSDLIVNYLNEVCPGKQLHILDLQLKQYRAILIPTLNSFDIQDIKNEEKLNELFDGILKTPEFVTLMRMSNEIKQRNATINLEKFERNQQIERLNKLFKRYLDLMENLKCLNRKNLL